MAPIAVRSLLHRIAVGIVEPVSSSRTASEPDSAVLRPSMIRMRQSSAHAADSTAVL